MNYGTCGEAKMLAACEPEHIEPLCEVMANSRNIAEDVLSLARKINGHLFGFGNACGEKEGESKCFRDELGKTRRALVETAEELQRICSQLGI